MTATHGTGTSYVLLGKVAAVLASFLNAVIVARALGPAGRGDSAVAVTVVILLPTIAILGSSPLLRNRIAGDLNSGERIFRGLRWQALTAGLVASVSIGPLQAWLLPSVSAEMRFAVMVSGPLCVVFGIVWICGSSVLVARGRTKAYASVILLPNVIPLFLIIGASVFGILTDYVVVWAQALSYLVTMIVVECLVRISPRGPTTNPFKVIALGLPFAMAQVVNSLSFKIDQALMLILVGSSLAGIYSVAATISLLPLAAGQAFAAASFRFVFDGEISGNADRGLPIRINALVACIVAILLIALVPWGITLLFGEAYSAAITPAVVGLTGGVLLSITQATSNLLIAKSRGWILSIASGAGLTVGLVVLVWFTPIIGVVGASLAMTINALVVLLIHLSACRIPWRNLIFRRSDFRALKLILHASTVDSR